MPTTKWKLVSEENMDELFKASGQPIEKLEQLKAKRTGKDIFETVTRDGDNISWTTDEWGTEISRKVKIGQWTEVDGPPGMPKGKVLLEADGEHAFKFQMVNGQVKMNGTRKVTGNEMCITATVNGVEGRRKFIKVQ